jgi:phosphoglycolate phosphatase
MLGRMWGIYPTHLTERTTLAPGTAECLAELVAAGCAIALVTNKRQTAAARIIEHFGLAGHFALIVGEPDRPNGLQLKPSGDMLKFALGRLGVEPAHSMMVGDSSADIRAAAAAGVFSIGLRNGYSTEPIEHYAPDVAIDSLLELPLALEAWRRRDRSSGARQPSAYRPGRAGAAR